MSGLPIRNFNLLLAALTNLSEGITKSFNLFDETLIPATRYSYTWDNYKIDLSSKPKKIVELLETGVEYQVLIDNLSDKYVPLYLGEDGENLTTSNSAFLLPPGGFGCNNILAPYVLWAVDDNNSDLVVTIHSTKQNHSRGNMPVPLQVKTEFPTGRKFRIPLNFDSGDGRYLLEGKLDSQLGLDGFRAFKIVSFDPIISANEGYQFNVKIDTSFSPVTTGRLQIHQLDKSTLSDLLIWFVFGWKDEYSGYPPINLPKEVKTWLADIQIGVGKFVLSPNLNSLYFGIKVEVSDEGWKSAVFTYNEATKTFTIKGF
ncbi:MAG: hypothetical protein F6K40_12225 [Okeania sp. SIO3I5]|uniref:hypothetical protein n=1 Tax=Okeania sp. SIO3I5 TaxID=2607805 RepID=UPI0013B967C1|nr:hypothetical protein [Okeania sp. SIO3I5]NEQ36996.1 hypothetical protein [Okeania sp. SIO3I5]